VYNGELFVQKCLESILSQSYKNLQIIVVDDGSCDKTPFILREMASMDSRIEIVWQENSGVSKARNAGLKIANGKWICFVDADDLITSDYCLSMLNAAESLSVDVLIAKPYTESDKETYYLYDTPKLIQSCLAFDEISFPFNIDAPWGKLFKASTLKENEILFPETLVRSEDAYFCMWFYEFSKSIGILNKFGYIHIEREGSLCRRFSKNAMQILEIILSENQKWVERYHPNDTDYICSLWYRVLPGIIECEKTYFFHTDNHDSYFHNALVYQQFLSQPMVRAAISSLRFERVKSIHYRFRLLIYKLKLGWFFILMKRK